MDHLDPPPRFLSGSKRSREKTGRSAIPIAVHLGSNYGTGEGDSRPLSGAPMPAARVMPCPYTLYHTV